MVKLNTIKAVLINYLGNPYYRILILVLLMWYFHDFFIIYASSNITIILKLFLIYFLIWLFIDSLMEIIWDYPINNKQRRILVVWASFVLFSIPYIMNISIKNNLLDNKIIILLILQIALVIFINLLKKLRSIRFAFLTTYISLIIFFIIYPFMGFQIIFFSLMFTSLLLMVGLRIIELPISFFRDYSEKIVNYKKYIENLKNNIKKREFPTSIKESIFYDDENLFYFLSVNNKIVSIYGEEVKENTKKNKIKKIISIKNQIIRKFKDSKIKYILKRLVRLTFQFILTIFMSKKTLFKGIKSTYQYYYNLPKNMREKRHMFQCDLINTEIETSLVDFIFNFNYVFKYYQKIPSQKGMRLLNELTKEIKLKMAREKYNEKVNNVLNSAKRAYYKNHRFTYKTYENYYNLLIGYINQINKLNIIQN